ncbi:hypothetical protein VE03_03834 [Pseudogymnoascus sp. 23342-1-I1]|nr:hypothetical protein VE03_03834 [Pseudogymnoascus sp. 23342-1-I1]
MGPRRGFEEITVKSLGHQSGRDRYPRKYVENNDIEVPRCVAWGMNLTALSQIYNIYIVAYHSKIYIYKPTGPQQLLTTEPLLILDLPSTPDADRLRATDPYSTHSINHLIVGNLGNHEIILCACGDGDVLAYYTAPIHHASLTPPTPPSSPPSTPPLRAPPQPTPFFHENVGISAWGLAMHTQSRLLAVSSNAHEVQVFAPALSPLIPAYNPTPPLSLPENFPTVGRALAGPKTRDYNFRVRVKLEPRGDNIPSIAFTSMPDGEADSVVASDIRGALWFIPLWANEHPTRVSTRPGGTNWRREPQGWGVVVLDDKFGCGAKGVEEAFGCAPAEEEGQWNISRSIAEVRGERVGAREQRAQNFFAWGYGAGDGFDIGEVEEVDLGLYWGDLLDEDGMDEDGDEEFDGDQDFNADLDDGDDDEEEEEEEESSSSPANSPHEPAPVPVPPGHLILHLNRHALTLYPQTGRPTFCSPVLRQDYSHAPPPFAHPMEFYNRLNMAVPIPGLSCVVVGCQVGRVGVVKVTKGGAREWRGGRGGRNGEVVPAATMRLESILPFAGQEGQGRERPTTGMHGVAVSPMPEWLPGVEGDEGGGGRRRRGVKRWRVMIQYWDLSVLSYVFSDERAMGMEGL